MQSVLAYGRRGASDSEGSQLIQILTVRAPLRASTCTSANPVLLEAGPRLPRAACLNGRQLRPTIDMIESIKAENWVSIQQSGARGAELNLLTSNHRQKPHQLIIKLLLIYNKFQITKIFFLCHFDRVFL